jgi:O-antigen/teichoic acid export membrane protein
MTATTAPAGPAPAATGVANRHKLMMLIATAARMAVGLLTFIILARFLGPRPFGVIATAMAYTGFVSLLSDFGFSISALRKASADPDRAGEIVGDGLVVKLILTTLVTLVGGGITLAVLPAAWLPVYAVVHVGTVAYSYADLTLVIARAKRRFDIEAKLVIISSLLMLAILGGITALTRDLMTAAIAFAGTRLLYLVLTLVVVGRWLGPIGSLRRDVATVVATIRGSASYAIDSILTNLSSQIDVLLFGALLSAYEMGVYQAGARLVQVIMPFAVVLSTVYMPALSAAAINGDAAQFRKSAKRLNLEFTALAIVAGLAFALVGPILTHVIYGNRYDALLSLWNGFGAFAILRLTAASYGIQLAALAHIRTRIAAQIVSILVFVVAAFGVLPRTGGLPLTSTLLAVSALPGTLVLAGSLIRDRRSGNSLLWSIGLSLVIAIALAAVRR